MGIPQLGRKYTMVIGAISGMALFFGFTGVRTSAQNVGISCAICESSAAGPQGTRSKQTC